MTGLCDGLVSQTEEMRTSTNATTKRKCDTIRLDEYREKETIVFLLSGTLYSAELLTI